MLTTTSGMQRRKRSSWAFTGAVIAGLMLVWMASLAGLALA